MDILGALLRDGVQHTDGGLPRNPFPLAASLAGLAEPCNESHESPKCHQIHGLPDDATSVLGKPLGIASHWGSDLVDGLGTSVERSETYGMMRQTSATL